jgi:hypothetical protein
MACQCNNCSGTGKCSTCSGTGELETSEQRSFRRTRLNRFEYPGPQLYGVWRYQTLAAVKKPAKPIMESEAVANSDAVPIIPKYAEELWPCSKEHWRGCDKCEKLVCVMHDYLVPVWPPETSAYEASDMICKQCIVEMWSRGDISQGSRTQYIH